MATLAGPQFDAIIVDEAQDFRAEWWGPLMDLRTAEGYLYLFLDGNQRICTPRPEEIHEVVLRFDRGEREPAPPAVEGEAPRIRPGVSVRQERRALQRLLHEVLGKGRLTPETWSS